MRALTTEALLQQLPMLQRLMNRLVDCRPTGAACQDHVVQVNAAACLSATACLPCDGLGSCFQCTIHRHSSNLQAGSLSAFPCTGAATSGLILPIRGVFCEVI